MFHVIQDHDGPFMTDDKSVMESGDIVLFASDNRADVEAALVTSINQWCGEQKDDGPEEFWRDYN